MYNLLKQILNKLISGDLSCLNPNNIVAVSNEAVRLLNKGNLDDNDIMIAEMIISISQIVYNNTDRSILFLDDGVYDILLELYKKYNSQFQVGAPVISFSQDGESTRGATLKEPIIFIDNAKEFLENSLYYNDLSKAPPITLDSFRYLTDRNSGVQVSKRNINVPHMYPKLVGSLDKCKFTLNKEAQERDVFDDDNVKIFERDFLAKHLQMNLIDMNTPFEMICELKYDGVSVEADVTHEIKSARSRGDANGDMAADLTDIFKGYRFPYAVEIPDNEAFGMKFEAIITHQNLEKMSKLRGRTYANSRNGIIGLLGSLDAYDYRDLITLIPLSTSIEGIDRVEEIEFLNKYYHSGEYLRYSVIKGTYTQILYQVYRFVKEAETIRPIMPFMYDGVVISYRDPNIIQALGRENSINKWQMAIKFNPMTREAIFTGYTYTIGQDGTITPMIHYTPIEFLGGIHTKSSGHSYKRFMELNLAIGDIIQAEYVNDVMPYITKPQVNHNFINNNPPEQFPIACPYCGTLVKISDSGKSAYCPNKDCPERNVAKITNMIAKLNIKDFGESTVRSLAIKSFHDLMELSNPNMKEFMIEVIGPVNTEKLLQRINEIKTTPIYDYKLMGSIGFSGIALETWKKILNVISLEEIKLLSDEDLYTKLRSIKGIGEVVSTTIVNERKDLANDIQVIMNLSNVIRTFGFKAVKTIRYTGCRPNEELTEYLFKLGCDARPNASVSRSTDILVVPYEGFTSSKTSKVGENTLVIPIDVFMSSVDNYVL